MTEAANESTKLPDRLELINRYQEMFSRQVNLGFQLGEIDEAAYRRFMSDSCTAEEIDDVYRHFYDMFGQLVDYLQDRLSERIIKGAEFIEDIGKDHPKYKAAMQKYDDLCNQLRASIERGRERESHT
ncbi:hypothetical protein WJ0W_006923 [Paenibacillus melissococcoides]|uniref:Uncharacterized protein n=1 Tax=Paenibacillus melissococcoides TaxID=2912268 RepID=A0ABM9GCJ6_9BACL|nr:MULTISPECIES: hypothetical protein [Paenibacillus]MEB9897407.1 hypothetical protein [Bacillus cereus]GIO82788.1 hypothetical protein J6TS7_63980 [Paenibacillus dendritiformis]CAH8249739.1 hypothetical protein WJ0W_006923 [Paenibacillus melissococcoides]CAH8721833.1 hypothetical protein WDD9_006487 [Paenibacillus melissococcoides]